MNIRERIGPIVFGSGIIVTLMLSLSFYNSFLNGKISQVEANWGVIASGVLGFLLVAVGMLLRVTTKPDLPVVDNAEKAKPKPPASDTSQDEWFRYYDQITGGSSIKPDPPPQDADRDVWFHWYHYITDVQGFKMTLRELATEIRLEYGYTKKVHSDYQAQYGTKQTPR